MLKIRLRRTGKRNQPTYRIVVAEARSKRNGKYFENLGYWNPNTKKIKINKKRFEYWLQHGAQPTLAVRRLHEKVT
jgi:small subunit ribosomal protein S16